MKILIVEDDRSVAQTLQLLLSGFNYATDLAEDGQIAWEMTEVFDYDLVLLDVGLPVLDGLTLCQKLRNKAFQSPILLLTGEGGAHQKAIALNAGADDYVVKPFDAEELIARVQALLRRGVVNAPILTCCHLALDPNSQQVTYGNNLLTLTPKEFAILELFLRHPEKTFHSTTILDRAWNSLDTPGEESVRVHIKVLRQKLRQAGAPSDLIQTLYRRGYRLNPMYADNFELKNDESLTPLQIAELKSANEQLREALDKLQATQAELQQTRAELELRVNDRTTELTKLNRRLKLQQEQSRAREEHLQLAIDALRVATAQMDLKSGKISWSDRMYQLLGYAPGEVEPKYERWSDRVLILQFDPHWQGTVVAESAIPDVTSMLSIMLYDPCFKKRYTQGKVCILNDLENSNLKPCYLEFLKHFQVKANLVVPILYTNSDRQEPERLWGLLTAQYCTGSHEWQLEEVTLLQELANQLGVAIEQSALYEQTRKELLERQRAELELRNSEARYRLLFDSIPQPVWVLDAESLRFLAVNKAAIDCYGYSRAEFSQMTLSTSGILRPEVMPEVIDIYSHVSSHQQNYLGIWQHTKRDGSQIDVEILAHSFKFEELPAYLVLVTDITERRQAERKIQEQAALLDVASDAIFVRDLEHRILYWNRGAESLYGWSASEVIGRSAKELLSDDDAQISAIMENLLDTGEWRGELNKTTKAGKKVIVEARWTLLRDESGQPKAILAVNSDVSEKKMLEAQFYRAQRLESLGTLASGIAHDLNNVFTPILAISQMMLSKQRKQLEEETGNSEVAVSPEMLQMLQDSAKRGAGMVSQILTFARGMEGKRIPVDIGSLLKEVFKVVRSTFPKSIQARLEIADRSLGLISADPTHIHQILLNLCVNARDAMPDGGILICAAKKFCADQLFAQMYLDARVGNYIAISITDTGTGIPLEVQERMFEPFFTTKSIGKGTGLGLSVVLGMVKNYGGFLKVVSEVGKGSKITVYLPTIKTSQAKEQSPVELPQGRGELILIADDELAVGRTNQSLLESYHYRTLLAADGVEAISLYKQHQNEIQAVVIDMMMPNMDGISAIAALTKLNPEVKIIAMSGLSSYRKSALDAGARAFIGKPYTLEDLLINLSEIIAS